MAKKKRKKTVPLKTLKAMRAGLTKLIKRRGG